MLLLARHRLGINHRDNPQKKLSEAPAFAARCPLEYARTRAPARPVAQHQHVLSRLHHPSLQEVRQSLRHAPLLRLARDGRPEALAPLHMSAGHDIRDRRGFVLARREESQRRRVRGALLAASLHGGTSSAVEGGSRVIGKWEARVVTECGRRCWAYLDASLFVLQLFLVEVGDGPRGARAEGEPARLGRGCRGGGEA